MNLKLIEDFRNSYVRICSYFVGIFNYFNPKNKFLPILVILALVITLFILFVVKPISPIQEEENNKVKDVDYTKNILQDPNFEKANFENWSKANDDFEGVSIFFDNIVKREGKYSLCITSKESHFVLGEKVVYFVYQRLENIPYDKKLILNVRMKTESFESTPKDSSNNLILQKEADWSAFVTLELYDRKDSLLTITNTDVIEGTTDWTHYTAWIRTQNKNSKYLLIKCALEGKGRVWFDNLELYPVEIQQKYFQTR